MIAVNRGGQFGGINCRLSPCKFSRSLVLFTVNKEILQQKLSGFDRFRDLMVVASVSQVEGAGFKSRLVHMKSGLKS